MPRCKYNKVFDFDSKKYRTCKKKYIYLNYCIIHQKILYEKYVILIQKTYKGFYTRKKLKIYYKLPRDLQRKIVWHINNNLYLKHFNSSLSKLIYKRYDKFNLDYKYFLNINYNLTFLELNKKSYEEFLYSFFFLIKLSIKYKLILNFNKIKNIDNIIHFTYKIKHYFPYNSDEYILLSNYSYLF